MNQIIGKLFNLAKTGKKEAFVQLIEEYKVFRNLDQLNGKDASLLIYSVNELKVGNTNVWKSLEDLYLSKQRSMNIIDHVMCGWSFTQTKNPLIQQSLLTTFNANWSQIKQTQKDKSNIGLIAFILSNFTPKESPVWRNIEFIYRETYRHVDERNFMLLLYSFARLEIDEEGTWNGFERYIWDKGFNTFDKKNRVMMIYSFSKAQRGSEQLWSDKGFDGFRDELRHTRDVQYLAWAFGNRTKGSEQFWTYLVKQTILLWQSLSIHDLEVIIWGLSTAQVPKQLWEDLTSQTFDIKSGQGNYSLVDELVNISKTLAQKDMIHSRLFGCLLAKFEEIICQPGVLEQYSKQLTLFSVFLSAKPELKEKLQQKLLKLCINPTVMKDVSHLFDMIGADDQFWSQIADTWNKLEYDKHHLRDYIYSGINIIKHSKKVIDKLSGSEIFKEVKNQPNQASLLCPMIKAFAQVSDTKFFEHFKHETQVHRQVMNRLLLAMLHKNSYMVPASQYETFLGITQDQNLNIAQIVDHIVNPNQKITLFGVDVDSFAIAIDSIDKEFEHQKEIRNRVLKSKVSLDDESNNIDLFHQKLKKRLDVFE